MREINIGGEAVIIRATPLALLYYRQAFGVDLTGDLLRMRDLAEKPEAFDACAILQMAWAMARADRGPGKSFPPFERWVADLGSVDFSDPALAGGILEEAQEGFFRGARPEPGAMHSGRPPARPAGPRVASAGQTGGPKPRRAKRA